MTIAVAAALLLTCAVPPPVENQDEAPAPETTAVTLRDYVACGPNCLYVVCKLHGLATSYRQVLEAAGPSDAAKTHSFQQLAQAAEQFGIRPVSLHVQLGELCRLPMPVIAQVRYPHLPDVAPHFVVVIRAEPGKVWVLDPPYAHALVSERSFATSFTGAVLAFPRTAAEDAAIERIVGSRSLAIVSNSRVWMAGLCLLPLIVFPLTTIRAARYVAVSFSRALWLRRRWTVGIAILAGGAAAFYAFCQRPTARPPRLVISESVVDLGELKPGSKQLEIPIANDGDAELIIKRVKSSCTCAIVEAPEAIPDRQARHLRVNLGITPGPGAARIEFESNDPDGTQSVTITWRGEDGIGLSPTVLHRTALISDGPQEFSVEVTFPGGPSAAVPELVECSCTSPRVSVRPGPTDPNAYPVTRGGVITHALGKRTFVVTVLPARQPESFSARCTLQFRRAEATVTKTFTVDTSFVHDRGLGVAGVLFAGSNLGDFVGNERIFYLDAFRGTNQASLASAVPPWLSVALDADAARGTRVTLRIVQPPPSRTATAEVQLKSNAGVLITIPVRVLAAVD